MLDVDCVDESLVGGAKAVYLEGYMWDSDWSRPALDETVRLARGGGVRLALSLSDPGCVERHRQTFAGLVLNGVIDLVFANEAEILELTGAPDFDAAVDAVRGRCEIAALTRGAMGSVVVTAAQVQPVDAHPAAQVVDTTGAGDLYAAGFLFGLSRGQSLLECARLGSLAAAEVIGVLGARVPRPLVDSAVDAGLV
jgi:sugar/nucleoside kinase (ribokinase family)